MRISRATALLFLCALIPASLSAQQSTPTSGPQTSSRLDHSAEPRCMTGSSPVTDATMTRTVTVTFNSVAQSGTITLVATSAGQSEVASNFSSGTGGEIRDISTGSPMMAVTGSDGAKLSVTTQSALSPNPSWFFPAFVLSEAISSSVYVSSYIGQEVQGTTSVYHLSLWPVPTNSSFSSVPTNLTRHDIYLDASTFLPVAITFNAHPYDLANPNAVLTPYQGNPVDQLEEVQFSDYRSVQGHPVAFHIHTLINLGAGPLVTDIQISSVQFNTGAIISVN